MQQLLLQGLETQLSQGGPQNTFSHSSRSDVLHEYVRSFSVTNERAKEALHLFGPHGAFYSRLSARVGKDETSSHRGVRRGV
jgi:hypothetical protein